MSASAPTFDAHAQRSRLSAMATGELRQLYRELSGDEARSRNREYLARRILWMLQAQALGGLSDRAAALAQGLAREFDVRTTAPQGRGAGVACPAPPTRDARLPAPGRAIVRHYKGQTIRVTVLAGGFEFMGERFGSLSAIAKAVTGTHVNGFRFFGLAKGAA